MTRDPLSAHAPTGPKDPAAQGHDAGGAGPARSMLLRAVFLSLGLMFTAAGFIGLFLPVIPTTPFLIVAVACFTRSSKRLEAWLLAQPHFGPLLRNWRERGAIPRFAKWLSLIGSGTGYLILLIGTAPGWPIALPVGAVIGAAMLYVFSRPDA